MDDLLREFLTETNESLNLVDAELVRFEQEPNNGKILGNVFRLVHTIKGTCGFLGLSRLETLAHAAETLMGKFRDGMPVTAEAVTVVLSTIDQIKTILDHIAAHEGEPPGSDHDLIDRLGRLAREEIVTPQLPALDPLGAACTDAKADDKPGADCREGPADERRDKQSEERSD